MAIQMKTKTLTQSVLLRAPPHEVYEALMDSTKHAEFTHSPATIDRKVGREFSTFDGWASGTTLELIPDKKIVQKWRAVDWPQGYYSTVTFELRAEGQETKLVFTQAGIPEDLYADLESGWVEFYWNNLVAYFS
jgi:activator of HSP90 ATPase